MRFLSTLSALIFLSPVAMAEDPEFTKADAAVAEKPETKVSAELGGTFASGNASFFAINGGLTASHQFDKNKFGLIAGVNLGQAVADADASGKLEQSERDVGYTKNVERFYAEGRYDRFLSDKDSVYLLAGGFKDIFAGYDLRTHEQIGYSRLLIKDDLTSLNTEIGVDFAQENYVEGVDPNNLNILAGRVMLGFTHKFNENVSFADTLEVYVNVLDPEDVRVLNTATLSSAISSNLSLKVSHSLIFDNVPVEGFEKLDQTTMLTLVASLL